MESQAVAAALINVVTMVLSVCVHEFAHAYAAFRLGDDHAAREGRLTLNPFAHADLVGTILLPAVAPFLGFGTFGWGKPVPYIPTHLTRRFTMRAGEAIVSFAGPFANLVLGTVCIVLHASSLRFGWLAPDSPLVVLLAAMVARNFVLFFFNLLPVPPLDGSKIAAWLFGQRADGILDTMAGAGGLGIMLAIAFGGVVAVPLGYAAMRLLYAGFQFVVG